MVEQDDKTASDQRELTAADVPAHVEEREGFPVIVTDRPMEPMTAEDARSAGDRTRPTVIASGKR